MTSRRMAALRNSRGVGPGNFTPGPNPEPDVQLSPHPALQTALIMDCCSTRSHAVEVLYVGSALDVAEPIPQSSLDHFHIHREPSRLLNPSVVQNNTSCRPSPCSWLSQPRTTTAAPPLVCLIGETWADKCRSGCAITLHKRASLVPLLTLKHPRLGFDV